MVVLLIQISYLQKKVTDAMILKCAKTALSVSILSLLACCRKELSWSLVAVLKYGSSYPLM